jgi:hypothetical protein
MDRHQAAILAWKTRKENDARRKKFSDIAKRAWKTRKRNEEIREKRSNSAKKSWITRRKMNRKIMLKEISRSKWAERFISKAEQVNNYRYDYSKINYTGSMSEITVICPEHGEFRVTPHAHLRGAGCNSCEIAQKFLLLLVEEVKKSLNGEEHEEKR